MQLLFRENLLPQTEIVHYSTRRICPSIRGRQLQYLDAGFGKEEDRDYEALHHRYC